MERRGGESKHTHTFYNSTHTSLSLSLSLYSHSLSVWVSAADVGVNPSERFEAFERITRSIHAPQATCPTERAARGEPDTAVQHNNAEGRSRSRRSFRQICLPSHRISRRAPTTPKTTTEINTRGSQTRSSCSRSILLLITITSSSQDWVLPDHWLLLSHPLPLLLPLPELRTS